MMEAVCKVAPESITTMVSLNPIMVDGTGMWSCRVEVIIRPDLPVLMALV